MSAEELSSTLEELLELRREREALEAAISAAEDAVKAHMGSAEELTAGAYRVRWQTVTTSRIDTAAFRRNCPAIAERYTRTNTARRFTVSAI